MKEAVVIKADGTVNSWQLERKPTLSEYQALVGGYIEVVQVRHDGKVCDMVLNENGLGLGLLHNKVASRMLENYWTEKYGSPEDRVPPGTVARVVGDVLILHGCRV